MDWDEIKCEWGNIFRTFVNAHIADTHEMHLHVATAAAVVVKCYENSRHDWDTRVFNFYLPLDN